MDNTGWSTPKSDWLYYLQPKMEKVYPVSKNKTKSWLWFGSWTSYWQIQIKWKKVGKSTRPFRYDLNQIPYDYTVEVRNRFKRLEADRWSAWWTMDRRSWFVWETGNKTIPKQKKKEAKRKGEKKIHTPLNAEFQRIVRRDKKAFLSDHCKEIEKNNRMGKTRDLFKKIRDTKGTLVYLDKQ